MINVKGIVQEYLKTNGFDGLCDNNRCACLVGDLIPCCNVNENECKPGYKYTREEFEELSSEGYINPEDFDYVICPRKKEN